MRIDKQPCPARVNVMPFPPDFRRTFLLGLLTAGSLMVLVGCANLAPDYTRPEAAVPHADPAASSDAAALDWRDFFSNERLRDTVALALANNRDLRVAALNVDKARAAFQVTDAGRLPTVTASADATKTQSSSSKNLQLALSSFEIDLFGRVKNLSESAQQSLFATAETRRSTQISLVAEVANSWLNLAADLERQRLAQQTLESRQRTLVLTRRQYALGAITGLELAQAQTAMESARVDAAAYPATVAQDRNALELLLGAALPQALQPTAADAQATVSALVDLPAGVPSSVLLQRPDVLAAEHSLIASHADIGAARAALFPTISLTASAGRSSSALSDLFKGGNGVWSYGPSISLPIFDGGASRASLRSAEVSRKIALATYDKTVQVAFGEVADALAVRATLSERMAAQQALNVSTTRQLQLAQAKYQAGSSTMLDVLDAQRSLYSAQQSMITLLLAEQSNRITLYKVLGGGWKNDKNES
jgi:outer membrane protein, multidrug efflux system